MLQRPFEPSRGYDKILIMDLNKTLITQLNDRSRDILRLVVDSYLETGEPVGSQTISRQLGSLSSATIRHVMADLEMMGLLYAPHTSAGRLPTSIGLNLFVNGLLEVGDLGVEEKKHINALCRTKGLDLKYILADVVTQLSGLSQGAGLVFTPKIDAPLKHLEFVALGIDRALVVMVTEDGLVENRLIDLPKGTTQSSLIEASNYLNNRLKGESLNHARDIILKEIKTGRAQLEELTQKIVEQGIAICTSHDVENAYLLLHGHANLLNDVKTVEDLESIRLLMQDLERQQTVVDLLQVVGHAEGVQIFIGADNSLFQHTGWSMVMAPLARRDAEDKPKTVGVIGVIGPARMNYARIIPMVDYTAQVVGNYLKNL